MMIPSGPNAEIGAPLRERKEARRLAIVRNLEQAAAYPVGDKIAALAIGLDAIEIADRCRVTKSRHFLRREIDHLHVAGHLGREVRGHLAPRRDHKPPVLSLARSFKNLDPGASYCLIISPFAMSISAIRSTSAAYSLPLASASPVGLSRPLTHSIVTTFPSGPSFEMKPLPSFFIGSPLTFDP